MPTTVLVVDDDEIFANMLTFALRLAGFETRCANNGTEAMGILAAETVDAIVLDVMLPQVDGYEICRRIRKSTFVGQVPILMLSARTQVADKLSGFDSGADDYVPKPANPKEVIARLHALIGRVQRARGLVAPTIALLGVKGGVGTSSIAVNMALALADTHRRTILVDVGCGASTAAWLLGLQPTQSLSALCSAERFQASLAVLQPCILRHPSGLHYLSGQSSEMSAPRPPMAALADALRILQSHYDVVVLDISVAGLPVAAEALYLASSIIPVAEYDGAAAWYLQPIEEWLRQRNLAPRVPGAVLVRKSRLAGGELPQNPAGLETLAVIPPATEVLAQATSERKPLFLADPHNPAALAMADLWRVVLSPPTTG